MDYCLESSPQDISLHHMVGGRFVGVSSKPLLSIKCMFGGVGDYTTDDGQRHKVDDSNYLVLNHDHDYTIEKSAQAPVETFCVFFPADFSSLLTSEFGRSDDQLIDADCASAAPQFNFFEHLRPHGGAVSRHIQKLRTNVLNDGLDSASLEQHLVSMLSSLLLEHSAVKKRLSTLSWSRAKTSEELYRRVHIARDFIHANLAEPFSIHQTASVANLSKYHFLRAFRQIMGETPLSYLQRIRLQKAQELLSTTKMSVTEISHSVGYESLPSFSSLFRTHAKCSPSGYRKQHLK